MGLRNPFRFGVNRENGDIYVGDYSPDADRADPARGPAGQGRWIVIRKPANYGWPFCATHKLRLRRLRLRDQDVGRAVQLQGAAQRLAAQHRPDDAAQGRPAGRLVLVHALAALPAVRARGAGGQRRHRADGRPGLRAGARQPVRVPLPELLRGQAALLRVVARLHQGDPPQRRTSGRRGIFPFNAFVDNPMDMEFGPDGALYVIEYGDGFFAENPDAQLSKINFVRGNRTPVVKVAATPDGRPRAAQGHVLERRDGRSRPGPALVRVGLRRRRRRRLARRRTRPTPTRATARTARR